tara:strand:- start:688 stop:1194 length:507 start_codon:yes stop_codon:yes gene_type:complete
MKDETYFFHQTPFDLCKELINKVPLQINDKVLEPFRGEGAFYNNLPDFIIKDWCEIEEGRDYKNYNDTIDWVISNPPFKLENDNGRRENAFYQLLEYYSSRVRKGVAFLANDYCFSTLTPARMKKLSDAGLYLQGYTVCNIKKWRGRYFFMIFTKQQNNNINYILGSY